MTHYNSHSLQRLMLYILYATGSHKRGLELLGPPIQAFGKEMRYNHLVLHSTLTLQRTRIVQSFQIQAAFKCLIKLRFVYVLYSTVPTSQKSDQINLRPLLWEWLPLISQSNECRCVPQVLFDCDRVTIPHLHTHRHTHHVPRATGVDVSLKSCLTVTGSQSHTCTRIAIHTKSLEQQV